MNLLAEKRQFSLPLPHARLMPLLGVNPFETLDEPLTPRSRVLEVSEGEDVVISYVASFWHSASA